MEKSEGAVVGGESVLRSVMLLARVEGSNISQTALQDTCINLLLSGMEQAATAITTTTYLLACGPAFSTKSGPSTDDTPAVPFVIDNKLWRRLVDEQAAVAAAHGDLIALKDSTASRKCIKATEDLGACISEGLRIAPPLVAVMRGVS